MAAVAAGLLGALFALAGAAKLRRPAGARDAVRILLPGAPAAPAVAALAITELALGLLLLSGRAPRAAALAALAALTLFGAALLALRRRVPGTGCGCFGDAAERPGGLARNAALAGLAVLVATEPEASLPANGSPGLVLARGALVLGVLLGWRWAFRLAREAPSVPLRPARGQTRRGFLERALVGTLAVGGAALAGDSERALAAGAPGGCTNGRRGASVCWSPWRVRRSEPSHGLPRGARGIAVRKGPSFAAPIVHVDGAPAIVPLGGYFGRQSRRGGPSAGCPDPGVRPASANGWVFGYLPAAAGGHAAVGWIPTELHRRRLAAPDDRFRAVLCGPEALDFDCRAGSERSSPYRAQCGPRGPGGRRMGYVCGGGREEVGTCFAPHETQVRAVRAGFSTGREDDLSAGRYLLRYTQGGAATLWLVPGDRVRAFCVACGRRRGDPACPPPPAGALSSSCCQSWSCVEVIAARWAPAGSRGWIDSSVLADQGTPPAVRQSLRQIVRDVFLV